VAKIDKLSIRLIEYFLLYKNPGNKSDSLTSQVLNLVKSIKFSFPEIDLSSFFRLNLPSVMIYVCIGVLLLTGFDRALYGIFHRGK
jgi:hypothetical protein